MTDKQWAIDLGNAYADYFAKHPEHRIESVPVPLWGPLADQPNP